MQNQIRDNLHEEQGGKAQQGDSFIWLSTFQSSSSDHALSKRSGRDFFFLNASGTYLGACILNILDS